MNTAEIPPDGPITGADLRALIQHGNMLNGSYVLPSVKALEELATAASTLRGRVRAARRAYMTREQQLSDDRKLRITEALKILARELPAIREEVAIEPLGAGWDCEEDGERYKFAQWVRREELRVIDTLDCAMRDAWECSALIPMQEMAVSHNPMMERFSDAYAVLPPSSVREIHKWHHFATYLADKFRDSVQASNPSKERLRNGGGDNPGPVARFLAALIPHITGETPNPLAVREYLRSVGKKSK